MLSLSRLASLLSLLSVIHASPLTSGLEDRSADASCTLTASGGDDAPSFVTAVQSCSTVTIPASTTLNISSKMNMTGLSNKQINLEGTIKINDNINYWAGNSFYFSYQTQNAFWLLGGSDITLTGGGTVDGSGQTWYKEFSSNSSLVRPILLTIYQAQNVLIENIKFLNAPEWFNFVNQGENITYNSVTLNATTLSGSEAKNTDGWDLYLSNNVVLSNSVINNGDDCVSFKPNVTNVLVSNLNCNGSHGISVGSLGQYSGEYDLVENITAINVVMSNAENGARIKAFAGSGVGSGLVKNITFTNFTESNVDSPVVIDQCYETSSSDCEKYPSNVYIEDIWFDSISGTSSGKEKAVVASLACSPNGRCSNVNVNSISLEPPSKYGSASYSCSNLVVGGNDASLFNCTTT